MYSDGRAEILKPGKFHSHDPDICSQLTFKPKKPQSSILKAKASNRKQSFKDLTERSQIRAAVWARSSAIQGEPRSRAAFLRVKRSQLQVVQAPDRDASRTASLWRFSRHVQLGRETPGVDPEQNPSGLRSSRLEYPA